ncbi:hypothetical protein P154DRAFT_254879 [Amniculicola lignicola CBS 123094]|uniref:Uncharacterized protein n=1 Tax=Amniculicola lignicola CBS 123094 TaxID=1392246 RepID=A0A6A5WX78_9PLEO|nr:hypothetical protein P154DRAFT_254879 [Amniculicola lignicola CBS 123094]
MALTSLPVAIVLLLQAVPLAYAQAVTADSCYSTHASGHDSYFFGTDANQWSSCISPYDQTQQSCIKSASTAFPGRGTDFQNAKTSCGCEQFKGSVKCASSACPAATGNSYLENIDYNYSLYCKVTGPVESAGATETATAAGTAASAGTTAGTGASATGKAASTTAGSGGSGSVRGLVDGVVPVAAALLALGIGAGAVLF